MDGNMFCHFSTLSVFNGFSDLVATLFTSFDPQIELTPKEGKTAPADDLPAHRGAPAAAD